MQSHGKNGRLDQHGAGRLEQQQFGTADRGQMRELRVVVYTVKSGEPRAELWGIVHKEVSLQEEKLITFSWNEDRRTV